MPRHICLFTVAVILFMATAASAFNHHRQGFALGVGLGVTPTARWETSFRAEEHVGFGVNGYIGYGWDAHNFLLFEVNSTRCGSEEVDWTDQGFIGPAWYHYFGRPGRSAFTMVGMGLYNFSSTYFGSLWNETRTRTNDPGPGMLLGGGYEFARHLQIGGYLGFGRTTGILGNYDHVHFSILVGAMGY